MVRFNLFAEWYRWLICWIAIHTLLTCKELKDDAWQEYVRGRPKVRVVWNKPTIGGIRQTFKEIEVGYPERASILKRDYVFGLIKEVVLGFTIIGLLVYVGFVR